MIYSLISQIKILKNKENNNFDQNWNFKNQRDQKKEIEKYKDQTRLFVNFEVTIYFPYLLHFDPPYNFSLC
jgi:hypothetical protein